MQTLLIFRLAVDNQSSARYAIQTRRVPAYPSGMERQSDVREERLDRNERDRRESAVSRMARIGLVPMRAAL